MHLTRARFLLVIPILLLGVSGSFRGNPISELSQEDRDAIMAVALDYIDGFYEADVGRMARALHPDVYKRDITTSGDTGNQVLRNMTASQLVEVTEGGMGARIAERDGRRSEVKILDVFNDLASVRVDAITWIDYLHVGKINGEWKIINVLWGWR
jgi:hypothetical protein